MNYKEAARDFIENEKQFHLGFLPTEQSSPLTRGLDQKFAASCEAGVRNLQEVDRNVLRSALKVLSADGASLSGKEAFSFALGFRRLHGVKVTRIKGTGWFGKVLDELRSGGGFRELPVPKGFKGKLRPYQKRGFSWMSMPREWPRP